MADNFIDIDDTQLDVEWLKQPRLMLKYSRRVAKARLVHSEAKAALEVTTAELSLKIREDPERYGLSKVTEDSVKAAIPLQKRHRLAVKAVNEARYELDMMEACTTALDHRKRALEGRVSLLGMEYYAEPRERGHGRRASEHIGKSVRKGIKVSVNDDGD